MSKFMRIARLAAGIGSLGAVSYYSAKEFKLEAASPLDPQFPKSKWDYNWDCRDERSDSSSKKPLVRRHLILIRHGQYNDKATREEDMKLTPLGREQARMTGERLKELGLRYDRLVHSSMTRATETAEIILQSLPPMPVERCPMLAEGAPIEPDPPPRFWKEPHHYHQDSARIEAAFRKYFHRASPKQEKDSYDIIVCHANVIRYFVCRALQIPPQAWLRMSLKHGSITVLVIGSGGRVSLRSLSEAGYMPPQSVST